MLNKISPDKYYEHLRKTKQVIGTIQWQDQYEFKINMEMPVKKDLVPPELIKSFSIRYPNVTLESSDLGTKKINYYFDANPLGVDVVFYNPILLDDEGLLGKDESILDYFTKTNGKSIIPTDGTFLLASEYYFYIECYALNASWKSKLLVKGYFSLNGEINQDFVSQGGDMQEIPVSFEPILL